MALVFCRMPADISHMHNLVIGLGRHRLCAAVRVVLALLHDATTTNRPALVPIHVRRDDRGR